MSIFKKTNKSLFYFKDGKKIPGAHSKIKGDYSEVWGDCSNLYGSCSGLKGNISRLWGNLSSLKGNCSELFGDCSQKSIKERFLWSISDLDLIAEEIKKNNSNIENYYE